MELLLMEGILKLNLQVTETDFASTQSLQVFVFDEQVTEYSNFWLSWGWKIPNKLMNLKPDIVTQTWT